MAHCCSQCDFTSNFESALTMHHQLHHEGEDLDKTTTDKSKSSSREEPPSPHSTYSSSRKHSPPSSVYYRKQNKGVKLSSRTSSATKLLGKLRARICRSKLLYPHPEEHLNFHELSAASDCTSKAQQQADSISRTSGITLCTSLVKQREVYSCHLCSFDADRITVLDRHLLNDHHIGMESLLQLVLAKTRDSLSDDPPTEAYPIRQPYYKTPKEIIENGEFVIETVTPKIKILKHTATNTDIQWQDIPDLRNNCRMITKELNKLIKYPQRLEKDDLLDKMQTLNECMCKFVDSSNVLKKVLSKDFEGRRSSIKDHNSSIEPLFELGLGEPETPREWQRAHSEKLDSRSRCKYRINRNEKPKLSAESYYF